MEARLGARPYTLGQELSVCDHYLFVFVLWTTRPILAGKLPDLPMLEAFGRRMAARQSVAAALQQEGLTYPLKAAPRA